MNRLLADLRIVELSAFVAAPLGGMTMAQFGAEVIRIDPIGGGIDFHRWPGTQDGASLYWAGTSPSVPIGGGLHLHPRAGAASGGEPLLGRDEQGEALGRAGARQAGR